VRPLVVTLSFSFCLVACSSTPVAFDAVIDDSAHAGANPVLVGEEFKLEVGQRAQIDGTASFVEFQGVGDDSRCAKGVVCVWEGNARAKFLLREDAHDEYVELNTSRRFDTRRAVARGTLVMRALDPQPPVTDPMRYVVTLLIEAGP